jgi:hypothetical protein
VAASDVYISADIEADGPIPGPYSMLSFGFTVAGRFDGEVFERVDPEISTFYRELTPISENFDSDALATSGLDRRRLLHEGTPPRQAMTDARAWVKAVAQGSRPVMVAYPLVFDWMFLHWYFTHFVDQGSPFGHSSALDMKTMYAVKARTVTTKATKSQMPPRLLSQRGHHHHALGDAVEQAEMFANLFEWDGSASYPI